MATGTIIEISHPPLDAISSVRFSPNGRSLLVGAWDNAVRVYHFDDGTGEFGLHVTRTCSAPVLGACWGPAANDSAEKAPGTFFGVGLDHNVTEFHLADEDETSPDVLNPHVLSTHGRASNKVAFSAAHGILVSTSWDATLHVHEPQSRRFVGVALAAKPFALALTGDRAVVAMADRKVAVYELQALRQLVEQAGETAAGAAPVGVEPWQQRESSLKFMTRDVACMPDGSGFATSSIEGRVSVDWFDPALEAQAYAFKCHRQKTTMTAADAVAQDIESAQGIPPAEVIEVDIVYPVNALAFHPTLGTFVTGGGDGVVAVWDAHTKRRIRHYPKLPAPVAALDFSPDGKYLAIGISPGFEDGKEGDDTDPELVKLYIRELGSNEVKGRSAKEKA